MNELKIIYIYLSGKLVSLNEPTKLGLGDYISMLQLLLPLLSSKSVVRKVRRARKELKRLRKDFEKERIDEEEYTLLRLKILMELKKDLNEENKNVF